MVSRKKLYVAAVIAIVSCAPMIAHARAVPPPDVDTATFTPRAFCTLKYGTSIVNGVLVNESDRPVFSPHNVGVCAVYCGSCQAPRSVRAGERDVRFGDDLFQGACLADLQRSERADLVRLECGG
jgi:hypothetical protein